ncbi:MAG: hypothetical protein GQ574_15130 [Crocinitomix sp.]|nr:hypothetical protein [Crocinitomix sp.]
MIEAKEVLDEHEKVVVKAPFLVVLLSVFAFIIHGFCLLGVVFALVMLFFPITGFGVPFRIDNLAMLKVGMVILFIATLAISGLTGANSMRKGKRKGFFYFGIGSVMLAAVVLYTTYLTWSFQPQPLNILIGLALIILVIAFWTQQKHLE